jgi:hypothetical protein
MGSPTCSVQIYQAGRHKSKDFVPCGRPACWRYLVRPDIYCCDKHEKAVMKLIWYDKWSIIKEDGNE